MVATGYCRGAAGRSEAPHLTKVLVPVDDSGQALAAVRHALRLAQPANVVEVHLLRVRGPVSRPLGRWLSRRGVGARVAPSADATLATACSLLDQHGVAHAAHVDRGAAVTAVERFARRLKVDLILLGAAPAPLLDRLVRRSLSAELKALTGVTVQVVAPECRRGLGRWGMPAGALALAVAALLMVFE